MIMLQMHENGNNARQEATYLGTEKLCLKSIWQELAILSGDAKNYHSSLHDFSMNYPI